MDIAESSSVFTDWGSANGGLLRMVTVAFALAVPARPMTVIVYVVVSLGETICDPVTSTSPISWLMDAESAFIELQVRVDSFPI